MERGVRVALGTDGPASNPDLDMLAEARHARMEHPSLSAETILRMATLSGAEALGFAGDTGSLRAGKSADMVVVPLGGDAPGDPHGGMLSVARGVTRVMTRGVWVA